MTVRTAPVPKNPEPNRRAKLKSKKARLITRLSTKKGACMDTLCTDFGWQAHTVRAALSRLRSDGHVVERSLGKSGSSYRIVTGSPT